MEMYIKLKGGERSLILTNEDIFREKCGVNFTPELWDTFSQLNLGKKEERIAKIF